MPLTAPSIRYDGAVKSFEALSISLANSGSSLHAIADRRTASTKNRATLLLNRRLTIRDFIWPSERKHSTGLTQRNAPRTLRRLLSFSAGSVNIVQRVQGRWSFL